MENKEDVREESNQERNERDTTLMTFGVGLLMLFGSIGLISLSRKNAALSRTVSEMRGQAQNQNDVINGLTREVMKMAFSLGKLSKNEVRIVKNNKCRKGD